MDHSKTILLRGVFYAKICIFGDIALISVCFVCLFLVLYTGLLPIKLSMHLQKCGVWGAALARWAFGVEPPSSQKIYYYFHFITIRPNINYTSDIF